ncbi:MAG: hypothetical protein IPI67_32920 [Myxococcales bacterium]|nr:hypothetical protein [Myxococcales bacterium]
MRSCWLGLVVVMGCATGEEVTDPNAAGGTSNGGTAQGGGGGGLAGMAGGFPTGGGGAGGSGGTAVGGGGSPGGSGGTSASGGGGSGGGGSGGGSGCSIQGCSDGNTSGVGCAAARTIGRTTASGVQGYVKTDTTCNLADASTGYGTGCADLGGDHTYRIYLRAGESISVALTQGSKCSTATSFNRTFKILSGANCSDTTCSVKTFCSPAAAGTYNKSLNVTQDGWYHLVVDGLTSGDAGSYTLTVKLNCKTAGCEC